MANKNEVGDIAARVRLDTIEFNESIKKLSNEFTKIDHQFKLASTGLDKVSDSSKITALTVDKLSKQVDIQKKSVDAWKQALEKAVAQGDGNTKQINKYELALKKSETTLASLEKQLKTATESMNRHGISASDAAKKFQELGVTWESTGRKFTQVGTAMTAAITAPILALGTLGVTFDASMQDYQASFETLLNSVEGAESMLMDLVEFAKSTPFEMTGLASATKKLIAYGISSRDVMKDLQMLGDVSLGNQEKLDSLANAYGQIQSTGRLMGQDLLQLINAGFNPLQIISEKTGRSMVNLKKDMENGAISAEMVTEALEDATSEGGRFFGAMEKSSKTFNGQMSTLKDTINITLGETMQPLFEELSNNIFPKVIAAVEKLGEYFSSLTDEQKTNALKWAAIAAAAGPVLLIVGKLISSIPALIMGIKGIGVAASFLVGNPIILGIAALAAGMAALVYLAGSADREIQAMTASLIAGYEEAAEAQKAAIDQAHAARLTALDDEMAAEDEASQARLDLMQEEYDAEVETISKQEQALKKGLQDRINALSDSHDKAIDAIRDEYGVFETGQKSRTEVVQDEAAAQKDIVKSVLDLSKDIASQEGKAFEKTYNAILEKATSIHDEKLRMYQEEYLKSVQLINQDLAQKVGGYQDEIDEITKKTAEEDRIAKEQADAQKIIDLQAKMDTAQGFADYTQASQDLADEINRQNREKELENRQIQIDSLNEQIRIATEKATEDKQNALELLQNKTDDQQVVIDAATNHEIEQIQKQRLAKENAENAKYNSAKSAMDREMDALDGWGERYKKELDQQLKDKQAAETAKLKLAQASIAAEQKIEQAAIAAEKAAADRTLAAQTTQANINAINAQIKQLQKPSYTSGFGNASTIANNQEIKRLEAEIEKMRATAHYNGLPGFAGGVVNWQGGLARVNEQGGEIQYLNRGTTVIPNDVSMQIAKSIGDAFGRIGSGGSGELISLMRELIGLFKMPQVVPFNVDGVQVGEAVFNGIVQAGIRRGTPIIKVR